MEKVDKKKLITQLAESIGDFIEYWGFKSIHGRIWALIYLSKEPISTPEIVKELDVSKGLVSIAINELIEYDLIEQSGKSTHGALLYIARKDIAQVVRQILRERELNKLNQVESNLRLLGSLSSDELENANISTKRLDSLQTLTMLHRSVLATVVSRNYKSIEDWLSFLRKISKVLSFKTR